MQMLYLRSDPMEGFVLVLACIALYLASVAFMVLGAAFMQPGAAKRFRHRDGGSR